MTKEKKWWMGRPKKVVGGVMSGFYLPQTTMDMLVEQSKTLGISRNDLVRSLLWDGLWRGLTVDLVQVVERYKRYSERELDGSVGPVKVEEEAAFEQALRVDDEVGRVSREKLR